MKSQRYFCWSARRTSGRVRSIVRGHAQQVHVVDGVLASANLGEVLARLDEHRHREAVDVGSPRRLERLDDVGLELRRRAPSTCLPMAGSRPTSLPQHFCVTFGLPHAFMKPASDASWSCGAIRSRPSNSSNRCWTGHVVASWNSGGLSAVSCFQNARSPSRPASGQAPRRVPMSNSTSSCSHSVANAS